MYIGTAKPQIMHELARRQLFSAFTRILAVLCCVFFLLPRMLIAAEAKAASPLEQELQAAPGEYSFELDI